MRGRKFNLVRMLGTSTVLTGLLLGLMAAPASAGRAGSPSAADEAQRARATGAAVEIAGLRTDTQRVYANPDGTRRAVFSVPAEQAAAIDGIWSGTASWTSISSQYPNQSYWMDSVARVGYLSDIGSTGVWRSIFQFDTSAVQGKIIDSAAFRVTLAHSWSCQSTPVQLWQTAAIDASTTWTSHAGSWPALLAQANGAANSTCGQPQQNMSFSGTALRDLVQQGASTANPTATVGLRAASETAQAQWKRFTPSTARLEVVYSEPLPLASGTTLS
ncbi:hypothetical protein OG792_12795 [Micromonospora sp. NBC_01699]|uniref:hypothetical protein n=1 Tax=Micromonospora sp. NBC_01699 TaxID=2975984 RepID=UPI002E30C846|nr:hypothetical protein [Micromonospora sp. NBC_01699]